MVCSLRRRSYWLASVAAVSLASFDCARADPAPAQTAAANDQIDTVIVTADKRKEDIKDVPISVSVIGASDLGDHHVVDYDALTRSIPGISFGTGASGSGAGEGLNNIEIRGVSSSTGSSTVSIYIDEVPITVRNTYDGATQPILFDLASVEVLRGPQGTLYGASSMGGTVRFLTNQPDLGKTTVDLVSDLSGTVHGSANYDEQAVLNVPVIPDVLAIRAGIDYGDDSGWIDQYGLDGTLDKSGSNDQRHLVMRLSAKYQPDPDLTITPSMVFQRVYSSDSPTFYPALGLYKSDKEVDEFSRDTFFIPSVTVEKKFDFATLTSVSSYFWRQMSRDADGTYYNSAVYADFFVQPTYPNTPQADITKLAELPSPVNYHTLYGQAEQELRLTSPTPAESGLPVKWVAGIYYADQWDTHRDYEPILGLNNTFQSIYGFTPANSLLGDPSNPGLYNDNMFYWSSSRTDERQYAAFGQVDFDILSNLHGAVGLRYLYARTSYTRYGGGFIDAGNISGYVQTSRYYAPTPKFSLTYDLSDESSLYAVAAKGFRLGGPTGPTPAGPGNGCSQDYANLGVTNPPVKYDSDKLWSYETGVKSRLFDNTLSLNGAIYFIDWKNLQQTIDLPICGFNFTSNVGDAESYGSELEVHYKPPFLHGLTVGATAGADHAVITATTNAATAAVGEKILYTPDWTATLSVNYDWTIDDLDAFVRADYDWTGRSHGSFQRSSPNYSDPQYGVANASIGVDTGTLQISLYATNLFDDQTIIQRPQVNTVIEGYTVKPLTIGLHVATQF